MSDWYNNLRTIQKARKEHDNQLENARIITPGEIVSQGGETTVTNMGLSFTWAKIRGSTHPPLAALNMTSVTAEGTPVLLARDPKLPHNWQIIGPDPTFVRAEMVSPIGNYGSGTHGSNHQIAEEASPGPDPVYVFQPMMKMLKTEGDGISLTVNTHAYDYNEGGISKYFAGATTDLTSSVPAAGLIRKVLLYLDRDTNILTTVEGTAVTDDSITPIPIPVVPVGVSGTKSAWVTLANGQTTVTTATDVDDARDFLSQSVSENQSTEEIFLTAAGGWPSETSGCARNAKTETTTNKQNYWSLDFDQTTIEYAEWTVWMPDDWNGGIIAAKFRWTADSGSGDVIWGLQGVAYDDDDDLDAAWGNPGEIVDSLSGAGKEHLTELTNAINIGGSSSPGRNVQFRVFRNTSIGNNLNADAKLMGVKIYYTKENVSSVNLEELPEAGTGWGYITANATIEKQISGSVTADAAIQTTETGSITADSTVEATETGSITADSAIAAALSSSVTADAAVEVPESSSATADAAVEVSKSSSVTADADIT